MTAAGMGLQAGAWAGGVPAQGGKQLGQAVRNAVKQGQGFPEGGRERGLTPEAKAD